MRAGLSDAATGAGLLTEVRVAPSDGGRGVVFSSQKRAMDVQRDRRKSIVVLALPRTEMRSPRTITVSPGHG